MTNSTYCRPSALAATASRLGPEGANERNSLVTQEARLSCLDPAFGLADTPDSRA
jgi:hypothetical protein